jgi:hypothetical protein
MFRIIFTAITIGLMSFSCTAEQGSFSMTFQWEEPPEGSVWIWVKIEERSDPLQTGAILASAGPAEYSATTGTTLRMPEVPNGSDRIVVVEVRKGPASSLPVLYYGLSESFSLVPGTAASVEVYLKLQKSQAETNQALVMLHFQGEEKAAVNREDIGNATLLTVTSEATTILVANDASFSANLRTFEIGSGEGITCVTVDSEDHCEIAGWDLTEGLPDTGDRQYSAFVKFSDCYGYETQVYRASTVLDTLPPQALSTSISSQWGRPGSDIFLTVTFDEEAADGASLLITPVAEAPVFTGPQRLGASTSYIWNATVDENVQTDSGPFSFSVQATDLLGNAS